jgi:F-type H+-transporting ATPase subunit gamma
MANLKEIRTRLASVQSTKQITSAMKMVSAAKLRKAQDAIIQMRPYARKLQEILVNLTGSLEEGQDNVYGTSREVKHVLLIIISSNKGLCGAFNANVAKKTMQLIENEYYNLKGDDSIEIIAIGKKAVDLLQSKNYTVNESHHDILEDLSYEMVVPLAKRIMKSYVAGIYDEVKIVYNQFRNAAIQNLVVEQYLPVVSTEEEEEDTIQETNSLHYILEPSRELIVKQLIPKSLRIQLFKAFLDSVASEHGARMTAMHKATDNATDLIKDLQLDYNKARQASITTEILEIVGGAEALKG